MAAIYGHVWKSLFREAEFLMLAKEEWGETLAGFEAETIVKAVQLCRNRFEMPPTLPQFVRLCRQCRPPKLSRPVIIPSRRIQDIRIAEKHIQEWFRILNIKRKAN